MSRRLSYRNSLQKVSSKTKRLIARISILLQHRDNVVEIPNELWDLLMADLLANHDGIQRFILEIDRFCAFAIKMVEHMEVTGRVIVDCTIDTDSEESKRKHFDYAQAMAGLRVFVAPKCTERLTTEILPLLKEYVASIEWLMKLCDERIKYKLEADHYVHKLETLQKENKDPERIHRNEEKLQTKKRELQLIETPLLLRLQDFEKRHDTIVSYAFAVFASAQKQFFAEISNAFNGYNDVVSPESSPSLPLILNHGSCQDIDEAKRSMTIDLQQPLSFPNLDKDANARSSIQELQSSVTPSPQSPVSIPPLSNRMASPSLALPPSQSVPPLPPSVRQLQRQPVPPPLPPPPPPGLVKKTTRR